MSVDLLNKQVNFNDGEGIFQEDFNDAQNFAAARLFDGLIQDSIGYCQTGGAGVPNPWMGGNNGFDPPLTRAFCLSIGRAFLKAGASGNGYVGIAPGTLLQKIAATNGDEAQLLSYSFDGSEQWELANGHATNPRLDLLQMKLEYETAASQSRDFEDATTGIVSTQSMDKRRRVRCTLSVKQGTAAASPTFPDPDAGCVVVGSVLVVATEAYGSPIDFSGGSGITTVHDQRMPVNVKCYRVYAKDFFTTAYNLSSLNTISTSAGAGTNELIAGCPVTKGRILGVGWTKNGTTEGVITFGAASTTLVASGLTTNQRTLTSIATSGHRAIDFLTFEGQHSGSPVLQQSATAKIGLPMWAGGRTMPTKGSDLTGAGQDFCGIRIVNTAAGMTITHVDFYVAEGI